jgi:hypothetical protein
MKFFGFSLAGLRAAVCVGFLAFSAASVSAATYYVSTTGSDTGGDGSSAKAWKTIGFGLGRMASGDTLIIKAGTYTDLQNFINGQANRIPSGTAGQYTTIMAETPGAVRIKNSGSLQYYDNPLNLPTSSSYIRVDGIVFEIANSVYPEFIGTIDGNFNKITRSFFKRGGQMEEYGGWVFMGGSNNLIEDSAGVGSGRYGFAMGGPGATTQRNILRRVVGRLDYSASDQPKATFNVYGNDSGTNVRDILLQNCIAVDGRKGKSGGQPTYGGFYFPKNVVNVTVQGSIVLNVEAEYAGYFLKEMNSQNVKIVDSIAWGGYGTSSIAGIRVNSAGNGFTVDHVTVGGYGVAYHNRESGSPRILTSSLFLNNAAASDSDYGWTTLASNAFNPSSQARGTSQVSVSASPLKYLVRAEAGSELSGKGADGRDVGANVTKRYGRSGTLWGEAGYDQLTTENLWPWILEDRIKAIFSEPNTPPSGAVPATNDTTRGFAAALDKFGKPMTLTRYVWQFLGNEIPADIYGTSTTTLQAPTGLTATVVAN